MKPIPFDRPVPAVALAPGAALLSHKATGNAARALGLPVAALSLLLAGVVAIGSLRSA